MSEEEIRKAIEDKVKNNKFMLFVKGTKDQPMCGFSHAVMQCFNELGVDYETVNVLEDPNLRPVLQKYSNWPTTPQVFINGEFVGGCDIVRELHASGELKKMVDAAVKS